MGAPPTTPTIPPTIEAMTGTADTGFAMRPSPESASVFMLSE
ncbi:hypothetical protein O973_02530 [Mycobacterium avium subsp. avium 11-4751]|nr:hypothetical protein O973_02530 [Mycobacterium avium subsp. avium 11-4751]